MISNEIFMQYSDYSGETESSKKKCSKRTLAFPFAFASAFAFGLASAFAAVLGAMGQGSMRQRCVT